MKITIADVAKKAGVSNSTVSRIINGNYNQSTKETVERVKLTIKELKYQPNALAQGLKSMKTRNIGIILSNLNNPFWSSVLEGVEDTCKKYRYTLMISNSNEEAQIEADHIKTFQTKQVDGIIINPTLKNLSLYKNLLAEKHPLVTINRKLYGLDVDLVVMDNILGAEIGVNHLINSGRRKIAIFVYQPDSISPWLERLEGYKIALTKNKIDVDDALINIVDENENEVKKAVKKVLSRKNRPNAIFSTNNMMTLSIMEAIREMKLEIPNDIALLGYDETVWSKHLNPPLTTIKQPAYKMGELAAERLIGLIEDKSNEKKEKIVETLEPQLIIRKSSGEKKGVSHE